MTVRTPWTPHPFQRYPEGHALSNAKGCVRCGMPIDHVNHRRPPRNAEHGMQAKPPDPFENSSTDAAIAESIHEDPLAYLRRMEATGNSCRECGGIMRRTGACETCESCGSNTGCG